MTLAPAWLRAVSDVNPLKHVVDAVRSLFQGEVTSSTTGWGVAAAAALVVVGLVVGTRTFRRETA
jgi:ABC-2 type transport system permease protein